MQNPQVVPDKKDLANKKVLEKFEKFTWHLGEKNQISCHFVDVISSFICC